ncbi:MAG TPA: serine/threonine-protein kinase [Kofleriaceae bacterium]
MQRIGRYEVLSHLATGGMGQVYLAKSTGLGGFERQVVVKTLEVDDESDPYVTMFLDEARLVGALHHQYIAPVYEVGRDETGRYFLVMDYIRGETVEKLWKRANERGERLPLEVALTVVRSIASALAYAHGLDAPDGTPLEIVHRDVSLSNIMIGHDGGVKLIDFGIAKSATRATRTQAGTLKGKFGYLAPEQVLQKPIDHRADIFALGVVLYELTTMQRAFVASSELVTLERITKGEVVAPSRHDAKYPRGLELIVMKALAVDPRLRFQSAHEFADEVEAFARRSGIALGDAPVAATMVAMFGGAKRRLGRGSNEMRELEREVPEEIADQELTVPLESAAQAAAPSPATMTAEVAPAREGLRGFWIALALFVVAAGVAVALGLT